MGCVESPRWRVRTELEICLANPPVLEAEGRSDKNSRDWIVANNSQKCLPLFEFPADLNQMIGTGS